MTSIPVPSEQESSLVAWIDVNMVTGSNGVNVRFIWLDFAYVVNHVSLWPIFIGSRYVPVFGREISLWSVAGLYIQSYIRRTSMDLPFVHIDVQHGSFDFPLAPIIKNAGDDEKIDQTTDFFVMLVYNTDVI